MKKNKFKLYFLPYIFCCLLLTSCNDFEEMNTNPTKSESVNPNSQLAYVQLCVWGDWLISQTHTFYCAGFTQLLQGDWNVTTYGGQYRRSDHEFTQLWTRIYSVSIKNMVDVIENTKDKPEYKNVRSISRIFKIYYSMILTDMYGDVPYFDAGKGYTHGIVQPAYDKQELIYKDFLKELKEIENILDENGDKVTGDVIYAGNITKWKRFANSLRLRTAMRLTKVDPEMAKSEVQDILNTTSGLLTENDNATLKFIDLLDWDAEEFRRNGLAQMWRGRETYPMPYICSTLWDKLKTSSDPRLFIYGRAYAEDSPNDPFNRTDLTEEILRLADIDKLQPVKPGFFWWDNWPSGYHSEITDKWEDKSCRPQANNIFIRGNAPGFILTYAEIQLLLAEAKVRWGSDLNNATSAEQHYKDGVTAAINLLSQYKDVDAVKANDIDLFLTKNPFPSNKEDQLKAINEQIWILHFVNPPEAYSNWRRSGYPVLKSSDEYKAQTIDSQTIPRRFNYPLFESSYNKEGYRSALEGLGGSDNWNKRVWWDKE